MVTVHLDPFASVRKGSALKLLGSIQGPGLRGLDAGRERLWVGAPPCLCIHLRGPQALGAHWGAAVLLPSMWVALGDVPQVTAPSSVQHRRQGKPFMRWASGCPVPALTNMDAPDNSGRTWVGGSH